PPPPASASSMMYAAARAASRRRAEEALHGLQQLGHREGLGEIAGEWRVGRGVADIREARHVDNAEVRAGGPELGDQLGAVHSRHEHVGDDEVERALVLLVDA